MPTEYLGDIERDRRLHANLEQVLPNVLALEDEQVETFVFYLKSLHSYYPATENHVAYCDKFSATLDALRNSKEQVQLQAKAARLVAVAMLIGGAAMVGVLLGAAVTVGGSAGPGVGVLAASIGVFFWAQRRFGMAALVAAKDQDRRYFLDSIRAARGCNELAWAGLFAHNGTEHPGPQSRDDEEQSWRRMSELSRQLRDALYNDEYRQYSRAKGVGSAKTS